jgi:hypothetical protein
MATERKGSGMTIPARLVGNPVYISEKKKSKIWSICSLHFRKKEQ